MNHKNMIETILIIVPYQVAPIERRKPQFVVEPVVFIRENEVRARTKSRHDDEEREAVGDGGPNARGFRSERLYKDEERRRRRRGKE